jgi:hypothetical protein
MKLLLRFLLMTKLARYRTVIGAGSLIAIEAIKHLLCGPSLQVAFPQLLTACNATAPLLDFLQIPAGYALGVGVIDKGATVGKALKVEPGPVENPYFPTNMMRPGT